MRYATIDFTSESTTRATAAWCFLALALLLRLYWCHLPEGVSYLGLLARLGTDSPLVSLFTAFVGVILVFGCCFAALKFTQQPEGSRRLLEGWPKGALRSLHWSRMISIAMIGLCLFKIEQQWAALVVCILLLRLQQLKPTQVGAFRRTGELLWDIKLCWLFVVIGKLLWSPIPETTLLRMSLAAVVVVYALTSQLHPRLSFAFCFFEAKMTTQVVFERFLWLGRLHRLGICLALAASSAHPETLLTLLPLCLTRWMVTAVFRDKLKRPGWSERLRSEVGPWADRLSKILPDRVSLDQYRPPRVTTTRPIDRYGDGPLEEPIDPLPHKVGSRPDRIPVEAVLAIVLFVLTVFQAVPTAVLPATEQDRITYQTRAASIQNKIVLFESSSEPDLSKILDSMDYPRVKVQVSPCADIFNWILALAVLAGLYFQWRGPLLGMWGLKRRSPSDWGNRICLSTLATVSLTSWMGWFWYPPGVAALAFSLVVLARKTTSWTALFSWLSELKESLGQVLGTPGNKPVQASPPESFLIHRLRQEELRIEVGRGLFYLVDPRQGELLKKRIERLREVYRKELGFTLPAVQLRDNLQLVPNEFQILVKEVSVGGGRIEGDWLVLGTVQELQSIRGVKTMEVLCEVPGVWVRKEQHDSLPKDLQVLDPSEAAVRTILAYLAVHLQEFITTSSTQKILNAATANHSDLVSSVTKTHSVRTIKKVVKEIVAEGYSLADRKVWLGALAEARGTDREIAEIVIQSMAGTALTEQQREVYSASV
jgi:FHIPEP family protein